MPRYKVIAPGYMNKTLHKPGNPRHGFVITPKPLKPVPDWLELVKEETQKQKSARVTALKKDIDEVAENKKDIDGVSFLGNKNVESV